MPHMKSALKQVVRVGIAMSLLTMAVGAQAPDARPQRPQLTPEQQAEQAKRREAEMIAPRPIAALDSVWMEELTWMEIRDAIKGGKTTGLILTGGVESNGPHLATGKHNFILKVMGDGARFYFIPEYYDRDGGKNCRAARHAHRGRDS